MGHEKALTTDTYYITLAQSQLSHNVYDALHRESLRLATYYKRPIDDLSLELPEAYDLLQQNPERDIDEGICTVPQTTSTLADSCVRASSCLDCPFLVPESRKRQAFVEERDLYIRRAAETTDSRIQQQRLRHAAMANAYVVLIDNVGPNSDSIKIEDNNKRPRKRSYKK
ncbi:hypothetical protein GCM10025859_12500 [Alicyclobacillus fastidiosus]|nr:hypothetical protein GCM10025859_12500 [Alicyclobacillus fastidiosus]